MPAAVSLAERIASVDAETARFRELLEAAADADEDDDFAELARDLAPLVDCDAEAAIPEELRGFQLPAPPADLTDRPYRPARGGRASDEAAPHAAAAAAAARRVVASRRA